MNTYAKHRMWIKTIGKNTFSVVITYGKTTTQEAIIEGLDAVRNRVVAFKTLYDGAFDVISDVNFT